MPDVRMCVGDDAAAQLRPGGDDGLSSRGRDGGFSQCRPLLWRGIDTVLCLAFALNIGASWLVPASGGLRQMISANGVMKA